MARGLRPSEVTTSGASRARHRAAAPADAEWRSGPLRGATGPNRPRHLVRQYAAKFIAHTEASTGAAPAIARDNARQREQRTMATVFYSWQSDRPTDSGRNLIERALGDAIKALNSDTELEEAERDELVLDKDTAGVPGSPPIMQTIFAKIDVTAAFVADLTFVGERPDGRLMPNPNVTVEYGWALKSLGHEHIIGVMNTAHGDPGTHALPFDLGHLRRPILYHCPLDPTEEARRKARKDLASDLKTALKAVFDHARRPSAAAAPTFSPRTPEEGHGRFRNGVEPIGEVHSRLPLLNDSAQRVWLPPGACMWLRLMPLSPLKGPLLSTKIESALLGSERAPSALNFHDQPFSARAVRSHDGFGLCSKVDDQNRTDAVFYVFQSGEVWTLDTAALVAPGQIMFDEKEFIASLRDCAKVLGNLGVPGPYTWIAGMEGIRGRPLLIANRPPTFPRPVAASPVVEETGTYSGLEHDAAKALEPFFEKVYDNHHLTRP